MGIRHVNSNSEPLTKELAQQFAKMPRLPGERELKQSRMAQLRTLLETGRFLAPIWAKGFCLEDQKHYRLDGQHTSELLATLESSFPDLTVTIVNYEFDSVAADAPNLFDIFNNPLSTRTDLDKLSVYRAGHADLEDIDHKFLEKVLKGIRFYEAKILKKPNVLSGRNKGTYLANRENRDFARWLWKFHDAKHGWLVGKDGVVGEICSDYHHDADLADEFWSFVFKENHPDVEHPTRELSSRLRDWSKSEKKRKAEQFYKETKKIWERYRRLRELEMSRQDETTPATQRSRSPGAGDLLERAARSIGTARLTGALT